MMDARKLPLERGMAWFLQAVNAGRQNPRPVFGAAILLLVTLYLLTFLLLLPVAWQGLEREGGPAFDVWLMGPIFIALICAFPVLLGGLMHVIRETEAGRPARARDLFVPVRSGAAKQLILLGLVQLALNVAVGVIVFVLAGPDYWGEYVAALQGAMSGNITVMPEPNHPILMLVVQIGFNYFSGAILLFSVPLLMFSGTSLREAVKLSLRAAIRNAGPNLGAAALFMLGVLVAALVASVAGLLLGAVGSLIHPVLGVALLSIVYLSFGATVVVVLTACAHAAWRDTFDNSEVPGPSIEAGNFEA